MSIRRLTLLFSATLLGIALLGPPPPDLAYAANDLIITRDETEPGQLYAGMDRLPIGPEGTVLVSRSTATHGYAWESGPPADISAAWPVGSIFISTSSANPSDLLGFGTWQQYGSGRMLVGLDAGQSEFDTLGETGGAKTNTLTTAELPAHAHGVTDPGHTHLTQRYPTATGSSSGFTIDTSMSGTPADNTLPVKSGATGVTVQNTGSGSAYSQLNPFIVVNFWRRTA